ncbi:receptor-type tyrosine-protein phosphatase C-like isoform X3 [Scleropages formosus]|uniref:receptor-type tyrosine-protein phosphatase C-like isoform X3 n=1 Tax=Scleropages formosus TaxID=113540 RepID=UPI0010FA8C41|nr:receptor-type tyrosine-protein phosphatase C isoform X3 [Scleropages formosus]XP_029110511.1 receptor-type tyrosine-protein phosphatase C isoform X3 [Scleropages formosus]
MFLNSSYNILFNKVYLTLLFLYAGSPTNTSSVSSTPTQTTISATEATSSVTSPPPTNTTSFLQGSSSSAEKVNSTSSASPTPFTTTPSAVASNDSTAVTTTEDCGSFTISKVRGGMTINVSGTADTVFFVDDEGRRYEINLYHNNITELEPWKTYQNITVLKKSCKLKGDSNFTTGEIGSDEITFHATKMTLCYKSDWNISAAKVFINSEPEPRNLSTKCVQLKKEESCQNVNVTFQFKNGNVSESVSKVYSTGPILDSVDIRHNQNVPNGIEWKNRPENCQNDSIHYNCIDEATKNNVSIDDLYPGEFNCTGTVFDGSKKPVNSGTVKLSLKCEFNNRMVSISNTSESTIIFSWSNDIKCTHPLLQSNRRFQSSCNSTNGSNCKVSFGNNQSTCSNLEPYTTYTCTVGLLYVNKVKNVTENVTQTVQTLAGTPDPVSNIQHELQSNNEVKVRWDFEGKPKGPKKFFAGTIKSSGTFENFNTTENEVEFKNLYYLTSYTVEIFVHNGIKASQTTMEHFKTSYNNKALIGFLAFFIVLTSVALIFVLFKIYLLQKRNSNNDDDERYPLTNIEENTLMNVEPIGADLLLETYKRKIADEGRLFLAEFQSIPRVFSKFHIKDARKASNQIKNRYVDILPYDYNRVRLSTSTDGSDYINASFIDGYKEPKKYIAAQGPKNETVVDFWRMVWEQQSSVIVMVTRCEEGNRNKCAQYWPSMDRETEIFEDFVVKISTEDHFPDYVIRHLTITNKREKSLEREVTHIQFTSWPDHGVPGEPHLLLKLRRRVNAFKNLFSGPIVVHCSAGVGRTGTYIGIDAMMEGLEAEGRMDIYGYVVKLRRQRCLMVQVEAQYILIHQALIEYTQFGETEIHLSELHSTLNTLKQKDLGSETTLLEMEFQRLPKYKNWRTCNTATSEENKKKNRYSRLVPFDYNRVLVKLEDEASRESDQEDEDYSTDEDDEDFTKYINASYIDGYWGPRCLIAAQGPLPDTRADFWQMIFQKKAKALVMLTDCMENGKEFCSPYWGDEKMVFEDIEVEMKDSNSCPAYETRCIEIRHTKRKESRKVYQYHFPRWTEQHLPENPRDLVDMIKSMKQKFEYDKMRPERNMPVVVHCNDGSTRTGLFCALWNVLESADTEKLMDIFQVVKALRKERPGMMLSFEQYQFLYNAVEQTYPTQNGEVKQNHAAGAAHVIDETEEAKKGQPEESAAGGIQEGDTNPKASEQAEQGVPSAGARTEGGGKAESQAAGRGRSQSPPRPPRTPRRLRKRKGSPTVPM